MLRLPLRLWDVLDRSQILLRRRGDVLARRDHRTELHLSRRLNQVTGLLIRDTRHRDDDVLIVLSRHFSFGNASAVNTLANNLNSLLQLFRSDLLTWVIQLRGQHHLGTALKVQCKLRKRTGLASDDATDKHSNHHEVNDRKPDERPTRMTLGARC